MYLKCEFVLLAPSSILACACDVLKPCMCEWQGIVLSAVTFHFDWEVEADRAARLMEATSGKPSKAKLAAVSTLICTNFL